MSRDASGQGAGDIVLLLIESFSSLWQLDLQRASLAGPCLLFDISGLKGPRSLGSFSIGQLLALACGERGYSDGSTLCP